MHRGTQRNRFERPFALEKPQSNGIFLGRIKVRNILGTQAVVGSSMISPQAQPIPSLYPALNTLSHSIIGAAIEVHRELGAGLLESAYQCALAYELTLRKIPFEAQKMCPVKYKDLLIQDAYRLDFLVGGAVVVELKTVDELLEVHEAQVLSYLKFSECRLGLLFNFRSTVLVRNGLRRLAL